MIFIPFYNFKQHRLDDEERNEIEKKELFVHGDDRHEEWETQTDN